MKASDGNSYSTAETLKTVVKSAVLHKTNLIFGTNFAPEGVLQIGCLKLHKSGRNTAIRTLNTVSSPFQLMQVASVFICPKIYK